MDSLPLRLDYESVIRLSTAAEPKDGLLLGKLFRKAGPFANSGALLEDNRLVRIDEDPVL